MPALISRQKAKALGLPRYFTGRKCQHSHVAEHYTGSGQCTACRITYLHVRRWKQTTSVCGVIVEANPDCTHWIVRCCGGRTRFRVEIGDVADQRINLPKMVVGAKVEFDLLDGEFPEDLEVTS